MQVISSPEELFSRVRVRRSEGCTIGFVPTMGALHEGHLSLIDVARSHADVVIVSSFVNPLQFNDPKDFDRYPATHEADERMCREREVDILYRPTPENMYPQGFSTSVHVAGLSDILEGSSRPGHFDGVATVVAKLFHAADPDVAIFGAKDFQQVAVIRRMVSDLGLHVRIHVAPTVREQDGLAMSSRNIRLDARSRSAATSLFRGLNAARKAFAAGSSEPARLIDAAMSELTGSDLVQVDYVHIVEPHNLNPVTVAGPSDVVLVAAIVGGVRLIDNVVLGTDG